MRYNLDSTLPINAFSPRAKGPFNRGMTLEGGGGGVVSSITNPISSALGTDGSGGGALGVIHSIGPVNFSSSGGWGFDITNPIDWRGAGDALASIDPGPAIGNVGAQLDKAVGQVIPGGWATLGVVALAIAAPYLAPYLAEAAPALTTAETAGDYAAGFSATGSAAGTASTVAYAAPTALQTALSAAGTGALYGGGIGGGLAAIQGGDPLKGALKGAFYGALTGGVGSGLNSALSATDLMSAGLSSTVAKALTSAATTALKGGDLSAMLQNGVLSAGLGELAKGANQYVDPIITNAGTGAIGSAIKGGDPLTGAISGAAGTVLGQGINAGKELYGSLTAPSASAEPINPATGQPVSEGSGLVGNGGLVNLVGIGEMSPELTGKYLTEAATTTANKVADLLPTISEQKAALLDQADTVKANNDAYIAAQNALKSSIDAQYGPMYKDVLGLQSKAQDLFSRVTEFQNTYDTNKAAYEASGNTDKAAYDAANAAAAQINILGPQYNTASQDFATANAQLTDLYKSDIAPLIETVQTAKSTLDGNVSTFSTAQTTLDKNIDTATSYITGLNDISQGKLPTDYKAAELAMSAPTAQGFTNEELAAIQKSQQDAVATPQPFDIKSTGVISDAAPGTLLDANFKPTNDTAAGVNVVTDGGKVVGLNDYTNAVNSGQPISIDDQLQTGAHVIVRGPTPEEMAKYNLPTPPVTPPADPNAPVTPPADPNAPVTPPADPNVPVDPDQAAIDQAALVPHDPR